MLDFACPNPACRARYRAPSKKAGSRLVCARAGCGWQIAVPVPPSGLSADQQAGQLGCDGGTPRCDPERDPPAAEQFPVEGTVPRPLASSATNQRVSGRKDWGWLPAIWVSTLAAATVFGAVVLPSSGRRVEKSAAQPLVVTNTNAEKAAPKPGDGLAPSAAAPENWDFQAFVLRFLRGPNVGLAVAGLVVLLGLAAGWTERCPHCWRLYARKSVGTIVEQRHRYYALVTRQATSRGMTWLPGGHGRPSVFAPSWSTTTWKERVPVVRSDLRHHYRCRHCLSEWDVRETVEEEDFGRR